MEKIEVKEEEEVVSQTEETQQPAPEKEKKHFKIFGVELVYLCFLAIIVGVIGWIAENVVRLVMQGVIDSRFHILPAIPVYGLIVFAVHLLFRDPDDMAFFGMRLFKEKSKKSVILSNLTCLLTIYAFVFFGELVVGNAWEMISGIEPWNYSDMPFHVTQYAGLIPTLGYGTGAYLLVKFCYRPAINLLQTKANYKVILIITLVVSALMIADEAAMLIQFFMGNKPVYWEIIF